jgi:hypothetical protein
MRSEIALMTQYTGLQRLSNHNVSTFSQAIDDRNILGSTQITWYA